MLSGPIGVFDSGIGGLTILRALMLRLPSEHFIYFADHKNCPYGGKSKGKILELSRNIVEFLLKKDCKLIVVACNTATSAAIKELRKEFHIDFVGIEPAIKPAALTTKTGHIGVLATKQTLNGEKFKTTKKKYARDINTHIQIGEGLVELVENGSIDDPEAINLVSKYIDPMLKENVDQIVLGCTHYPFLIPLIDHVTKGKARTIDPAPAIARRTKSILSEKNLLNTGSALSVTCYTSASTTTLLKYVKNLETEFGLKIPVIEP